MVGDRRGRSRIACSLDGAKRGRWRATTRRKRERESQGFEEEQRSAADLASCAEDDGMEYQLRHYRIRAGSMDAFLDAWLRGVYPLRRQFGFTFPGAWRVDGADEFVWIIGYEGPEGFAAADRRYYDSEERKRVTPDPARYIEAPVNKMMTSVLPD
jgi:hypothetical protein